MVTSFYFGRLGSSISSLVISQHGITIKFASPYRGSSADIIEEFDDSSTSKQVYEDLSGIGLRILENGVTSMA